MKYIIIAVLSYLLGSFCVSVPLTRHFFGEDVRDLGSGNAGATNVARCFGLKAGLVTLLCDMLKTVIAMLIGMYMAAESGEALAGVFCIIGHCFPVYFGFRGGKGVSVGAALGLMQGLTVFAVIMAVFGVTAFLGKKVSLASVLAALTLPVASILFLKPDSFIIMSLFSCVLVIFMHRFNIIRLIKGTEPTFKPKKL